MTRVLEMTGLRFGLRWGARAGITRMDLKHVVILTNAGRRICCQATPEKGVISTNAVRRNLAFRLDGRERFLAALEMTEGGRNDRVKVWGKVGGPGGDNKDGLKTCCHFDERGEENLLSRHSGKSCHFDERSEEKSCVPPEQEEKISRCARNDREGRMTKSVRMT